MRALVFALPTLPLSVALFAFACSSSSASPSSDASTPDTGEDAACFPAPQSCDAPKTSMSQLDVARGCLLAPATLADVCATSVNRCGPSEGLGPACAIAPDGRVFVAAAFSDNFVLTAKGWQFELPFSSYPPQLASAYPKEQMASDTQGQACADALCVPPCPGVPPLPGRELVCPDLDAGAPPSDATDGG